MSSADRWLLQVFVAALLPVMIVSGAVRRSTSATFPAHEHDKLESPPDACVLDGTSHVAWASVNFRFARRRHSLEALRRWVTAPCNSSGTMGNQEILYGKT